MATAAVGTSLPYVAAVSPTTDYNRVANQVLKPPFVLLETIIK